MLVCKFLSPSTVDVLVTPCSKIVTHNYTGFALRYQHNVTDNLEPDNNRVGAMTALAKLTTVTFAYTASDASFQLVVAWSYQLQIGTLQNETRRSQHSQECKTHAGTVFVPRDLDLSLSEPQINELRGLMVEHLCVKFGDPSCSGFWDIVQKNRRTGAQTNKQTDRRRLKPYLRDCRRRG